MIHYDNKGNQVIAEGTNDPRYTVRFYLIRQGRPKYWNFHCIYCGEKVCELNGTVIYMTDISSQGLTSGVMQATRVRCNSRKCGGRAWFSFEF